MTQSGAPCVGLDLGSEYVSVAVWNDKKQSAEMVTNDVGNRATPAVVAFTDEEALVAEVAVKQQHKNFANTVRLAPALLGEQFSSEAVQNIVKSVQYKTSANASNGQVTIEIKDGAEKYSPEQIVSKVLAKMKVFAESYINQPTPNVVIAVPRRYTQVNKDAVKEAATLAGFNEVTFISEPAASILAHGFDKATDLAAKKVLVFDFGASSADATVASVQQGLIEILADKSDATVGGVHFNEALAQHLAGIFDKKFGTDVQSSKKAMAKLLIQAERTKIILSTAQDAHVIMDSLFEGNDLHTKVTRTKLEMITRKLIAGTKQVVDEALQAAKIHPDDIDEVLLVGGSSQIVKIAKVMTDKFANANVHKELCLDSVAQGAVLHAAIQANLYGPEPKKADDVDVLATQTNLGVAGANSKMAVLIPRGTVLPASATETFTTSVDQQAAVFVEIFEGPHTQTAENNLLAQTSLAVSPKPAGQALVQVTFSLSATGELSVTATSDGKNTQVQIKHNDGTNSAAQTAVLDKQAKRDLAKFDGSYEDSDAEADDDEYEPPVELEDDDEEFDLGEDDLD